MKLICWDLETFRYDLLFGCIIIDKDKETLYQTWDLDEVREFFKNTKDNSIYIGYNSKYYDDVVLEAIIKHQDPYKKSKEIKEEIDKYLDEIRKKHQLLSDSDAKYAELEEKRKKT